MAVDHPGRVLKAALIDILPNWCVWTNATSRWALNSWHWSFMAQPAPFPEEMIGAVDPRWYMEKKLSKPGIGLAHCEGAAFDEYVRCFTAKTIHGSCEDYRACATTDLEMDTEDKENGVTCDMPVLVVWARRVTPAGYTATYCRSGATGAPTPLAARSSAAITCRKKRRVRPWTGS